MFFAYILYSKQINKFYIGVSSDPIKRLKYHNRSRGGGKRSFTKRASDWDIVWTKRFYTKNEALSFERDLKRYKSRRKIESLIWGRSSAGRAVGS
ncbi:MAG: GIY-YIG nuclease family protein [Patescibacteria group bacterium]|nr:GIY-YIG nuclease family protein [Patescibacteria group bacterium]